MKLLRAEFPRNHQPVLDEESMKEFEASEKVRFSKHLSGDTSLTSGADVENQYGSASLDLLGGEQLEILSYPQNLCIFRWTRLESGHSLIHICVS